MVYNEENNFLFFFNNKEASSRVSLIVIILLSIYKGLIPLDLEIYNLQVVGSLRVKGSELLKNTIY